MERIARELPAFDTPVVARADSCVDHSAPRMSRVRDIAAFVVVAWAWGLTFAAVEVGLESFPPLLLMALRYDVAGVVLLGYVVARTGMWRPSTRADVFAIVGGGVFWIAVGNGIWFAGQQLTSSVMSGVMPSLIPIATTVFSWVLLPEDRLSPTALLGVVGHRRRRRHPRAELRGRRTAGGERQPRVVGRGRLSEPDCDRPRVSAVLLAAAPLARGRGNPHHLPRPGRRDYRRVGPLRRAGHAPSGGRLRRRHHRVRPAEA